MVAVDARYDDEEADQGGKLLLSADADDEELAVATVSTRTCDGTSADIGGTSVPSPNASCSGGSRFAVDGDGCLLRPSLRQLLPLLIPPPTHDADGGMTAGDPTRGP